MTTEKGLAVTSINALPISLEEVRGMAEAFIKSGMFSDTKSLAQAMVKIQAGRELGLPPVYSMQNINLIRDRLTTSANTMALLVKRSGKYNYRVGSHTDTECKIEFFEGNKTVGWSTFTIEDAKRANLVKPDSGWVKYPRAMLFSRAISQGARIYAPDAIGGIYTDEEIQSIPLTVKEVRSESPPPKETEGNKSPAQEDTPQNLQPDAISKGEDTLAERVTELYGWVSKERNLTGDKNIRAWLTGYAKIPPQRIDTEPEKVLAELKAHFERQSK